MPDRKDLKTEVIFRVDGNQQIGLGHVFRSLNLAKELKKVLNCRIKFYFISNPATRGLVKAGGFMPFSIKRKIAPAQEIRLLYPTADILIVDTPLISPDFLSKIKNKIRLSAVIAEDKNDLKQAADIFVCPNLKLDFFNQDKKGIKCFSGKKFIILNSEFGRLAKKRKIPGKDVKRVIICFGGSDPHNITGKLAKALNNAGSYRKGRKIIFALGPAYGQKQALISLLRKHKGISVKFAIPSLAKELEKADLAVLSGSTLMYEAAALGVPALIICQNNKQDEEARIFHRYKAVINLGNYKAISQPQILKAFRRLLSDRDLRIGLSRRSRELVAADGARNIACLISLKYKEKINK